MKAASCRRPPSSMRCTLTSSAESNARIEGESGVNPQPEQHLESDSYSLADLLRYFLRLGTFGFGGPIALVGYMQRDLVERRQWFSKQDFVEGLALAQLAPGPLAAQLA